VEYLKEKQSEGKISVQTVKQVMHGDPAQTFQPIPRSAAIPFDSDKISIYDSASALLAPISSLILLMTIMATISV